MYIDVNTLFTFEVSKVTTKVFWRDRTMLKHHFLSNSPSHLLSVTA
jgi:hypothetical protein